MADYAPKKTLTSNNTFSVPAGYAIRGIYFKNTTANAVTGGIRFGTTDGGAEVVTAQTVSANLIGHVTDANTLKKYFSSSANTTIYVQAVTAWNSASVDITLDLVKVA